jgi:hypothetical protein
MLRCKPALIDKQMLALQNLSFNLTPVKNYHLINRFAVTNKLWTGDYDDVLMGALMERKL